jgi:hypothetical protein
MCLGVLEKMLVLQGRPSVVRTCAQIAAFVLGHQDLCSMVATGDEKWQFL